MLHIEGTPHEKALLVISSYIIGFVSAYIAFTYAFPVNGVQPAVTYTPAPPTQTAAVTESQPPAETAVTEEPSAAPAATIDMVYENQGLYLYGQAAEPMLLSKHADAVNVTYTSDMSLEDKQGLHSAVPAYEYFTEHDLVYFCESYADEDSCVPYIYDIENTSLQVVQTADGPVTVSVAEASDVTMDTIGTLQLGQYTATSAAQPWQVTTR